VDCSPAFGPEFVGIGLSHGAVPYIESNPRDVVLEHLKGGVSKEASIFQ